MAVDISKVFKANVKAIKMNQGDNPGDVLNQDLLPKGKKKNNEKSFAKEAKNIVLLISNLTYL
jgi:hypothetical protein